jgi:hypothetical protein
MNDARAALRSRLRAVDALLQAGDGADRPAQDRSAECAIVYLVDDESAEEGCGSVERCSGPADL